MTSRTLSLVVWGLIAVSLVTTQVIAVTTRRIPTATEFVRSIVRRPGVRLVTLALWFWVGWHFFVRSSR
jgi:hypothetical protein